LLIVTSSLVGFLAFQPNSSAFVVIAVTVVMGIGMANVMAPCTDSIMGSLPRAKAGVGSAVNDTTRQTGGAIGVAVFGSLMASHYRSQFTARVGATLPAALFDQVRDNVGQAIGVATNSTVAKPFAGQIVSAAGSSFVSGIHLIGLVAACITFTAAVGVFIFLPARARPEPEPIETGGATDRAAAVPPVPAT
jgi:hypothetical protein